MTKIRLRRDTSANWASSNPILALGEPGIETNTRKIKVGDGSTSWNSLSYLSGGDGITFVGDDSTGVYLNPGETLKIAGGTGITTAVSGDTLTITGVPQATMTFVGDDSTGTTTEQRET